jgi:hypothetical protein
VLVDEPGVVKKPLLVKRRAIDDAVAAALVCLSPGCEASFPPSAVDAWKHHMNTAHPSAVASV